MNSKKVLVYGYGNPGRQDDAAGIVMADNMGAWAKTNGYSWLETDQNYQLNIEDADKISDYDLVVFVDASIIEIDTFLLESVYPDLKTDFSMHSCSPSFILGLCGEISKNCPKVYQLHIKAYEFGFMKEISEATRKNLEEAERFLKKFLLKFLSS